MEAFTGDLKSNIRNERRLAAAKATDFVLAKIL
jgi:hypothetical protein